MVGRTREEAMERATVLAAGAKFNIEQDEDVLDTWFSSGLWPFSIMGWPENVGDPPTYLTYAYLFIDPRSPKVLPIITSGDWLGHSLLLGCTYGITGH